MICTTRTVARHWPLYGATLALLCWGCSIQLPAVVDAQRDIDGASGADGSSKTDSSRYGAPARDSSSDVSSAASDTNAYDVEVQWGGSSAPWSLDGIWIIGGRATTRAIALDIESTDAGKTFNGTMTYAGEGPIGFKAEQLCGSSYNTSVQWGGSSAPWNDNGTWVIGGRAGQPIIAVEISSTDGGQTFTGTMTYSGEGPISFKAQQNPTAGFNSYATEVQWGGSSAPWHGNGVWIIGGRGSQHAVALDITSEDGGKTFTGTMSYAGEGPIGFKATGTRGNGFDTEVQWGGSGAPWNKDGSWVIGCREPQRAVAVKISSADGGKTFTGTMSYDGEGPISLKATNLN